MNTLLNSGICINYCKQGAVLWHLTFFQLNVSIVRILCAIIILGWYYLLNNTCILYVVEIGCIE